jgi:hypothetical protein
MNNIEIIPIEASESLARVCVRLPRPTGTEATLCGTISGPYAEHARTLAADFPLRDLGPGPMLQAEALITEPCYWKPDAPYQYRVSVEIRDATGVVATHEENWALRRP